MTQILVSNGSKVIVQNYAPQLKGLNKSINYPKGNEVVTVSNVSIRKATKEDALIIKNLANNPTAQVFYFNSL